MGPKLWFEGLDLSKLTPEDRVRLLKYAVDKHGAERVLAVGILPLFGLLSQDLATAIASL